MKSDHRAALYIANAILDRFGKNKKTGALCDLFLNRKELRNAVTRRAMQAFGITSANGLSLEDDE
jgi:hypothetical protein